jgi:hypothetical protein
MLFEWSSCRAVHWRDRVRRVMQRTLVGINFEVVSKRSTFGRHSIGLPTRSTATMGGLERRG